MAEQRTATVEAKEGKFVGYAIVWDSPSLPLSEPGIRGAFVERVDRAAFERSLAEFPTVRALVDHDPTKVLATTANGSLRLLPDEYGLRVEITPADTSYARDLMALVDSETIRGMSFRFYLRPDGDSWDRSTTPPTRTIHSAVLEEVSITIRTPAYPNTSVEVRAASTNAYHALRLRLANA